VTVQNLFTTISSKTCSENVHNFSQTIPSTVWMNLKFAGHENHRSSAPPPIIEISKMAKLEIRGKYSTRKRTFLANNNQKKIATPVFIKELQVGKYTKENFNKFVNINN